MRKLAAALALCVSLSSCGVERAVRISYEKIDGERSEIVLTAKREGKPPRLSADYSLLVAAAGGGGGAWYPTSREGPVVAKDLAPGVYELRVDGRRFKSPRKMHLQLRPGERAHVTIKVRRLRGMDSAEGTLASFGKVLKTTAMVVGVTAAVTLYVALELYLETEEVDE